MARRRDMPGVLAALNDARTTPYWAVLAGTAVIVALVLLGDVRTTWSLSAFTVLIYYSLTNLAALRLPRELRRYPRWIAVVGLCASIVLAFWIETPILLAGLGAVAAGLLWHAVARRYAPSKVLPTST
jgi:basic amino acid/polyamine antiporter, APA family